MAALLDDRSREEADLGEIPPAVFCAACGSPTCSGCRESLADEQTQTRKLEALPWETGGPFFERLVKTALFTAEAPARAFGGLSRGAVKSALVFATLAEGLAVSSMLLLVVGIFRVLSPGLVRLVFAAPVSWVALAVLALTLTSLLVFVHAYWGLLIEKGIASIGVQPERRLGMRFGLYAAGWDLVTSPAGILLGAPSRGLRIGLSAISAIRVPARALDFYLSDCRHLGQADARTVRRFVVRKAARQTFATAAVAVVLAVLFALRGYF